MSFKQVMSAVITFALYSILLGWKVGLLLMVAIGFHEYGHLWAANRMGLRTKGFYFLPFMGGVALVGDRYKTYAQQAFVVLMGPAWGGALAAVSWGVYFLTHQAFWLQAANWMAIINLFNLFPLAFLDGGQLLGTLTYSINRTLGMICYSISTLVATVALYQFNPLISVMIGFFGGMSVATEVKNWWNYRRGDTWLVPDHYLNPPKRLALWQAFLTVGSWVVLTVALIAMTVVIRHTPNSDLMLLFKK